MIQCDDCLEALQWLYIIIWTESSDKTINNILCEVRLLTNDGYRIYEEGMMYAIIILIQLNSTPALYTKCWNLSWWRGSLIW